jgi:hypothetical protein
MSSATVHLLFLSHTLALNNKDVHPCNLVHLCVATLPISPGMHPSATAVRSPNAAGIFTCHTVGTGVLQALPEVVHQGVHHARCIGQDALPEEEVHDLALMYGGERDDSTLLTPITQVRSLAFLLDDVVRARPMLCRRIDNRSAVHKQLYIAGSVSCDERGVFGAWHMAMTSIARCSQALTVCDEMEPHQERGVCLRKIEAWATPYAADAATSNGVAGECEREVAAQEQAQVQQQRQLQCLSKQARHEEDWDWMCALTAELSSAGLAVGKVRE